MTSDHASPVAPLFHLRGSERNVGAAERWISLLTGVALVGNAVRSRSALNVMGAAAGAVLLHRGATGHCAVYQRLGVSSADDEGNATLPYGRGIRVERSVTIDRSAAELFQFWRNFANLPYFMDNIVDVRLVDETHSHWTVAGPAASIIEWDAEIINEIPDQLLAWKTSGQSEVVHAGSVHFKELAHGRGTEVHVVLRYDPPGGKLGGFVARIFGEDPALQVAGDLRRLKRFMEVGEEVTVEGQTSAREESRS